MSEGVEPVAYVPVVQRSVSVTVDVVASGTESDVAVVQTLTCKELNAAPFITTLPIFLDEMVAPFVLSVGGIGFQFDPPSVEYVRAHVPPLASPSLTQPIFPVRISDEYVFEVVCHPVNTLPAPY